MTNRIIRLPALLLGGILALPLSALAAEDSSAPKTVGWRGNFTGLFPDADPPTHCGRIAQGVVAGMTCQSEKPAEGSPGSGQAVRDGLIRQWLVIGPFPVTDSVKEFDQEQIAGEAQLMPAEGDKVDELAWQRLELVKKPDYDRWGTTELDWVDLGEPLGYKPNQIAYAHSYLHCRRPGKVAVVVDHGHGLKVWVNGTPAYANPDRNMALGSYVGISRQKKDLVHGRSPRFEIELKQGWNRLLVKVGAYNRRGWRSMKFAPRLMDVEPAAYQEKNVVWMTELPERTNAVPIIVGDRIFTVAEPDELLCLDKATGKILWRRFNGHYNAIGVGAGATLGGKHIYVLDNQGTCVVLEPGPVFKQVAVNRIETVIQRDWPIPPQEIVANGAPVFDGKYMYLRGERYLYCIGETP
ncbi:MAG: outer membrane protein assembly factor BamB family protein [Planctomycetota bacterium]|jgi:hypothetical protein